MSKSLTFLKNMMKERKPRFISFRFTDTHGGCHQMTRLVHKVDEDLINIRVSIDGSSIAGWRGIENSDMQLVPDWDTAHYDPFMEETTLAVFCNAVYTSGKPYERCPRTIGARALEYLNKTGVATDAFFGPEPEFFIFDSVQWKTDMNNTFVKINSEEGVWSTGTDLEDGNTGHRPLLKGGYMPLAPVDHVVELRNEMTLRMLDVGVIAELHHHEVAAAGQCEIGVRFNSLVHMGDDVQKMKYVIRGVAHEHGKTATFMPKPLMGDNGSGMHVHQSLFKGAKNMFFGKKYAGLSQEALWYIGGVLKHARALNAICNASVNSYKRLLPGYEAPTRLAYSENNRSAAVRIPFTSDKARRFEVRFPDPTANPYLCFSSLLLAGLDGIKNKIDPGDPADFNLYDLSDPRNKNVKEICSELHEALRELDKGRSFLTKTGVFDNDTIDAYLELKWEEVDTFLQSQHPIEFHMYYSR